jgi:hypothetical protein
MPEIEHSKVLIVLDYHDDCLETFWIKFTRVLVARREAAIAAVDLTQLVSVSHRTPFMDLSHELKLHTLVVEVRSQYTRQSGQTML